MSVQVKLETPAVEPGGALRGEVRWESTGDVEALVLALVWHTEGKGTEDVGAVHEERIEMPGPVGTRQFELVAPEFPYSFSGRLISLVWSLEASLVPGDDTGSANFTCAPGGQEIVLS